ncbi:DUF3618 domain-containing protein [Nocardioides sp. TRM66260-LWL]|uniref:DUF3618 domain-containing protein n=1 Tax=Nocardioides sp. TRM66260-LWL TaxID=2874478 RepID=UPI001CC4AB1A|nr:DUF3618 domain-containing protein [Nocardioides sp. TRM66260-LWL]MBZ5732960.1 DUF3618 domain-containing protein [Nocardioides sp. TRM66260-LWL]
MSKKPHSADRAAQLEREIAEARERLAVSVGQLAYRAKPQTIVRREVSSVKARFVDPATGQPRTDVIVKVAGVVVGSLTVIVLIRRANR